MEEFLAPGKVKFAYRHMAFLGPESILAAEASECAAAQAQFLPYHDLIFQTQGSENSGVFTVDKLVSLADQIGLDQSRFRLCLVSHKYKTVVEESTQQAKDIGVRGTPTILINGRLAQDPSNLAAMRKIILEELALNP